MLSRDRIHPVGPTSAGNPYHHTVWHTRDDLPFSGNPPGPDAKLLNAGRSDKLDTAIFDLYLGAP